MIMFLIYKITNKVNNKIYIGQTTNIKRRWSVHKAMAAKNKGCIKYSNAINKYGDSQFHIEILEQTECKTTANDLEIKLIAQYDCINSGYNITKGGEGITGYHHSYKTKKKISRIMKKKSHLIGKNHRGINAPISKLGIQDIQHIRELLADGKMLQKDIAIMYSVSPSAISTIKTGKTYIDY